MPYVEKHKTEWKNVDSRDFYGASTSAMIALMKEKGYRLVGAHRFGGNCIFMRNDVGVEYFSEKSINDVRHHRYFDEVAPQRWKVVKDKPWETV